MPSDSYSPRKTFTFKFQITRQVGCPSENELFWLVFSIAHDSFKVMGAFFGIDRHCWTEEFDLRWGGFNHIEEIFISLPCCSIFDFNDDLSCNFNRDFTAGFAIFIWCFIVAGILGVRICATEPVGYFCRIVCIGYNCTEQYGGSIFYITTVIGVWR